MTAADFASKLRWFSRACALVVLAAGLATLAGWVFDVPLLKAPAPGLAQIKGNAAVSFLLAGLSLWLLTARTPRRAAGLLLGAFVGAYGALSLSQDLFGWSAGIDEILFHDPEVQAAGEPGRLAPAAALSLALVGSALAALATRRAQLSQTLVLPVLFLALIFLFGYLFGAPALYAMEGYTTVALYAAMTMLVLVVGIACADPREGWVASIASDTEAAHVRRPMLAAALVLLPLLAWLRLQGEVRGLYTTETGVAILLVASMVVVVAIVLWSTAKENTVEAKLRRYGDRLQVLHEIDRGIIASRTPEAIAEAVLRPLRDLLGVPRAIVNLFDYEKGEVEWLAAIGRSRTRIGPSVRYPLALMGDLDAMRRGEPQLIDTESLPASAEREALLASGVRWYMAMPMLAGGQLIGALSFGGERREFPAEQLEVAREAAAQLAIAVVQARLHEQVSRQAAELERRVAERTGELEVANRELEAFAYTVSHDLRAPLRALEGFARIFETEYAGRVDDEGRRQLGIIRDSGRRMSTLIEGLLAFSVLGREALHPAPVDMAALAGDVWKELGAGSAATCVISALPSAQGDVRLLRQVWANLIGNAIKYSAKRPSPVITVTGSRENGDLHYCVSDNGVGFDPRHAAKLFGVFSRLHAESDFPGSGVGLATVQRIVVRHGGHVWAEGAPGAGAKFYFALPAAD